MSFTFHWPRFSDQFHYDAIQMLNTALNKGSKPPIIADRIEVVELEMGTQPPELEIRDIGDLTVDQFRGIFRLTYTGNAHLVLKTKVQANPLNHKQPDTSIHLMGGSRGMLAAKQPLVVPMLLRLSHFRLSSYVVLVVSKQKGITLVFKTDPLQHVDINSTFDSIAVIQNFIQREIEGQLRQMFREDLPGIIHRLSQQWVKAKVEAPYLAKRPLAAPIQGRRTFDAMSAPDVTHRHPASDLGIGSGMQHPLNTPPLASPSLNLNLSINPPTRRLPRAASTSGISLHRPPFPPSSSSYSSSPLSSSTLSSAPISTPKPTPPEPPASSHPDLENFDPTYGLRPEGLPTKSVFKGFSSLFTPNKGLADLAEEAEMEEGSSVAASSEFEYEESVEGEGESFDFVDWDEADRRSGQHEQQREPEVQYETIPAVGGGTITRPRVYHSQSAIQTHTHMHTHSRSAIPNITLSRSLSSLPPPPPLSRSASNPYFPEYPPPLNLPPGLATAGPSRLPLPSHHNLNHGLSSSAASTTGVPLRTAPPGYGYGYNYGYGYPDSDSPESQSLSNSRSNSGPSMRKSALSSELNGYAYPYRPDVNSEPDTDALEEDAELEREMERRSATATSAIYMRRPPSERRMSVASASTTATARTAYSTLTTTNTNTITPNLNTNSTQHHPHPSSSPYRHTHPSQTQNASSSSSHLPQNISLSTSPSHHTTTPLNASSIHKLSTLSTSNHTLSPYTRDLSHFTVRSVPPRSGSSGGLGAGGALGGGGYGHGYGHGYGAGGVAERAGQPVKARRKRTYRIGGKAAVPVEPSLAEADKDGDKDKDKGKTSTRRKRTRAGGQRGSSSPTLRSDMEFDESDMDRYFAREREHEHEHEHQDEPDDQVESQSQSQPTTSTPVKRGARARPGLVAHADSTSTSSGTGTVTGVGLGVGKR